MSKLVAFLVAAAGASAVSTGGVFMLKNGGGGKGTHDAQTQSQKDTSTQTIDKNLGFETLATFKSSNGGSCVSNHFPQINFSNLSTSSTSFEKLTASSFSGADSNAQSCLIVNGKKTEYTSSTSGTTTDKGKGNFSLLGSFVNGDNGFVLFVTTKPFSTEKEMGLEGGLYVSKKSNSNWSIEKYKELDSNAKVNNGDFETKFPKAGTSLETNKKPYGGFVTGKEELDKICKETSDASCGTLKTDSQQPSHEAGLWKFSSESEANKKKIGEWIDKLEDWIKALFGNEDLGLHTAVESFKGTGTKQN